MISRSQMNRQFYNMGGEGIMQMAPQQMQDPQQMQAPQQMQDPQQMQQADAEQYRPIADSLSQDPKKALAMLIKMLIEQGVPPEEARKIAMEMIQGVAQGGMEEVSDDNRIEARFGGRMGYASGGIGRLVDREQYGFGSVFKSVGKAVSGAVKGVTSAVKSVASSKLGRIALTIAAGYYLGSIGFASSFGPVGGAAMRAGFANLAVQAASGQKINFGEALTSAAIGGITGGVTQGGDAAAGAADGVTEYGVDSISSQSNPTLANFSGETANGLYDPTDMGGGAVGIENLQGKFGQSTGLRLDNPNLAGYTDVKGGSSMNIFGPNGRLEAIQSNLGDGNYMDALKQVSGAAIDNPLTTTLGLSSLAAASVPGQPEQLPGESMEEYNARVEQWKTTLNANLGNTPGNPYLMPASANNPYYGVQAANGGRIGYLFGGSGVSASAVAQPVDGQPMPVSGGGKGIGGMLRNLIANNPEIFRQVTSQQTMSPMQQSSGPIPLGLVNYSGTPYENAIKKTSVAQPTVGGSTYSSGGGFGGLGVGSNLIKQIAKQSFFNPNMNQEEDTRYKLPASARNPMYGMMANGGRMGYAAGSIFKGLTKLAKEKAKQTKLTKQLDEAFDLAASRHDFDFSDYKMRNDIMAEELAEIKYGKNYDDLNLNTRLDLYDEAFDYLNDKAADYGDTMYDAFKERGGQANGGRMGYAYGNSVQEGIMAAPQIANQMGMPVGNPRQNQSGVSELDYRDQGGFVPPIGIKEKEDDIPAMLSNNEFVFTADAVKNAGGGDPNVGAQKMYAMMKQLENGGMA
jgi:hypothetical protein